MPTNKNVPEQARNKKEADEEQSQIRAKHERKAHRKQQDEVGGDDIPATAGDRGAREPKSTSQGSE